MKKLALLIPICLFMLQISMLLLSPKVIAIDILKDASGSGQDACSRNANIAVCKDKSNGTDPITGPGGVFSTIVNVLSIVIGVAAVITIVIMGIRFITSQGDASSVANARRGLLYALVGLVVAATARLLVSFILGRVNV